jgi:hypothetical protein
MEIARRFWLAAVSLLRIRLVFDGVEEQETIQPRDDRV